MDMHIRIMWDYKAQGWALLLFGEYKGTYGTLKEAVDMIWHKEVL